MTTYSSKSNAIRAARSALAEKIPAGAMCGVHFVIDQEGDAFTWRELDLTAAPPKDGDPRSPRLRKADAEAQAEGYPNAARAAQAKRAQAEAEARGADPEKAKKTAPKEGGVVATKVAELLRLVQSPEGLSEAQLKSITGWSKFGGFYAAVKNAGLALRREKKDGVNVWYATAKEAVAA